MATAASSSAKPLDEFMAETDLSDSPAVDSSSAPSAAPNGAPSAAKKKKKKKKKAAKPVAGADEDDVLLAQAARANAASVKAGGKAPPPPAPSQPARPSSSLCISRNKHWRHISAYHVRPPLAFPSLRSVC